MKKQEAAHEKISGEDFIACTWVHASDTQMRSFPPTQSSASGVGYFGKLEGSSTVRQTLWVSGRGGCVAGYLPWSIQGLQLGKQFPFNSK